MESLLSAVADLELDDEQQDPEKEKTDSRGSLKMKSVGKLWGKSRWNAQTTME